MKNLIFVTVLGTAMMFASCKKESSNDVVITKKNTTDTIINGVTMLRPTSYYGTWVETSCTNVPMLTTIVSYKITKDSIWEYINSVPADYYGRGTTWYIDTIQNPNVFVTGGQGNEPLLDQYITQASTNGIFKLTSGEYTVTFQRQ